MDDDVVGSDGDHSDAAPGVNEVPALAVEDDGGVVEGVATALVAKGEVEEVDAG